MKASIIEKLFSDQAMHSKDSVTTSEVERKLDHLLGKIRDLKMELQVRGGGAGGKKDFNNGDLDLDALRHEVASLSTRLTKSKGEKDKLLGKTSELSILWIL